MKTGGLFFCHAHAGLPAERRKPMYLGKQIRLERILDRNDHRTIIVPMDHGVSMGPLPGIRDMRTTLFNLAEGGADCVLMHKGQIRCTFRHEGRDLGLIMHMSASTDHSPSANSKALVASVEEAIRHGADGVSVHVNLGDPDEERMLADLGRVAEHCDNWGMPLLAMIYGRGPKIRDSFAPEVIAHCARIGVELGADIVKVSYTGDMPSFRDAIEGCSIPVVIAGGPVMDSTRSVLEMVSGAMQAGAAGCSIGRNVFEHPHRIQLLTAMRAIVHGNADLETAIKLAGE